MKLKIQDGDEAEIVRKFPEFKGIKNILLINNGVFEIEILSPDNIDFCIRLKKATIQFHAGDKDGETTMELTGFIYNENNDSFKQIRLFLV